MALHVQLEPVTARYMKLTHFGFLAPLFLREAW